MSFKTPYASVPAVPSPPRLASSSCAHAPSRASSGGRHGISASHSFESKSSETSVHEHERPTSRNSKSSGSTSISKYAKVFREKAAIVRKEMEDGPKHSQPAQNSANVFKADEARSERDQPGYRGILQARTPLSGTLTSCEFDITNAFLTCRLYQSSRQFALSQNSSLLGNDTFKIPHVALAQGLNLGHLRPVQGATDGPCASALRWPILTKCMMQVDLQVHAGVLHTSHSEPRFMRLGKPRVSP
eukprot:2679102-Rhodomonas_salina.1